MIFTERLSKTYNCYFYGLHLIGELCYNHCFIFAVKNALLLFYVFILLHAIFMPLEDSMFILLLVLLLLFFMFWKF